MGFISIKHEANIIIEARWTLDHEVLKGEGFTSISSWECKGFKVNIKSLKHSQKVGVGFYYFF